MNSKCILAIGANPIVSHPPRGMDILEGKRKNGAKLIVVDPRRTIFARQADLWLQIRPGTDMALVLAMINYVIAEKLYDADFVSRFCTGFDQLRERVKDFTPEKAAEITWISVDQIKQAASMYASIKPATMHHRVAVEQNLNATQTCRAITILMALTGNIDVKSGNLIPEPIPGYKSNASLRVLPQFRLDPVKENLRIGAKEFPLISGPNAISLFVHAGLANEAMLTGKPYPIKALFTAGGNPAVTMQNPRLVWKAMHNLDLHIVADFFMTPGAEIADYVLPAALWPERDEVCDAMYMNFISLRQKVVEPLYECWSDMKMSIELVNRVPWANRQAIPWHSEEEFNNWRLKDMGLTFAEFAEKGYVTVTPKYRKYEQKGFTTPSGKVELYSSTFEKLGYDPLPAYIEPLESPVSTPDLAREYPLVLTSGGRYPAYYHSDGRQIESLRRLVPDPYIEINPETAAGAGISDGDWVYVETPRGKGQKASFRAKVTDSVDPRVVQAAHAWWFPEKPGPEHGCFESNVSTLFTCELPWDPITGAVPLRGTLCRVYRR